MPRVKGLTDKQQIFVREYLIDFNGTRAAIAAGYSKRSASALAQEVLDSPVVQDALAEALLERTSRLEITADDILRELWIIVQADVTMFEWDEKDGIKAKPGVPEHMTRAVASLDIDNKAKRRKFRLWSKTDALKTLTQNFQTLLAVSLAAKADGGIDLNLSNGAEYDPESLEARTTTTLPDDDD